MTIKEAKKELKEIIRYTKRPATERKHRRGFKRVEE